MSANRIRAALADSGILNGGRLTRNDARALVDWLNTNHFGGWFTRAGRSLDDVLGVFSIESNFDPGAIGDRHLEDMSWGIGQVRGTTAQDRGFNDPRALLDPGTGALASMAHLKWSWDFLESRLRRAPTLSEWIGSYNAGVGNALRGNLPQTYLDRWEVAAGR